MSTCNICCAYFDVIRPRKKRGVYATALLLSRPLSLSLSLSWQDVLGSYSFDTVHPHPPTHTHTHTHTHTGGGRGGVQRQCDSAKVTAAGQIGAIICQGQVRCRRGEGCLFRHRTAHKARRRTRRRRRVGGAAADSPSHF